MSLMECANYKEIIDKIRIEIGDSALNHISENNPEKFLSFSKENNYKKLNKKAKLENKEMNILFLESISTNSTKNGDCSSNG